ncbi:hypothetical protein IAT38_003194 [Cryptococcus sp. DSM 104549]
MPPSSTTTSPGWHVRPVTVPGPDSDLALYVSFNHMRLLFGVGEGTQRALGQRGFHLKYLKGLFVNNGRSQGRGGLAGMIMTVADSGTTDLTVAGPPDIAHYMASLRGSVSRDNVNINLRPYPVDTPPGQPVDVLVTPQVTVSAIALIPPRPSSSPSTTSPSTTSPRPSYGTKNPMEFDFQPASLSPVDLQDWCLKVASAMFRGNGEAKKGSKQTDGSPPPLLHRTGALVTPSGSIQYTRVDHRVVLPVVTEQAVDTDMVYICTTPPVRGKFDAAKAKELGVPNGPDRGKLTNGLPIEVLDSNVKGGVRVIRPEDCMQPGGPGSILIVVNCTEKTMDLLLDNRWFEGFQRPRAKEEQTTREVHLVVHHVPRVVWQSHRYQEWMAAFGPQTQHALSEPSVEPTQTVFAGAAQQLLQLSVIDEDIFRPPFTTPANSTPPPLPPMTTFLTPSTFCEMFPRGALREIPLPQEVPFELAQDQVPDMRQSIRDRLPLYAQAVDDAHKAVRADPRFNSTAKLPGDDIVVTTLGTGSAIPSKYRNVSSTHLDIPGSGGVLLDAGEGTLGQMRRLFGLRQGGIKKMFEELKLVFISHMHGDHQFGLAAVLEERFKLGITKPLYIVAPYAMALHLQELGSWQRAASDEALRGVIWIPVDRLSERFEDDQSMSSLLETTGPLPASPPSSPGKQARRDYPIKRWPFGEVHGMTRATSTLHISSATKMLDALGLKSIQTPGVPHRGKSYGLALEHRSGWKVVYSGDTKPSGNLVRAGKGATLLIHEATMEDGMEAAAASKGHSTFSQALDIGKQMGARYILLNHFSQRYPKLPKLPTPIPADPSDTSVLSSAPTASISFDFMSLRLSDMWKMAYYMDALAVMFPADDADYEDSLELAVGKGVTSVKEEDSQEQQDGGDEWQKQGKGVMPPGADTAAASTSGEAPPMSKKAMKRQEAKRVKAEKEAARKERELQEVEARATTEADDNREDAMCTGEAARGGQDAKVTLQEQGPALDENAGHRLSGEDSEEGMTSSEEGQPGAKRKKDSLSRPRERSKRFALEAWSRESSVAAPGAIDAEGRA